MFCTCFISTRAHTVTITWSRYQTVPTTKLDILRPHRHQSRQSRPHPQPPANCVADPRTDTKVVADAATATTVGVLAADAADAAGAALL